MNISLGEIFNSKESLQKLLEADLPIKIAFRLAKLAKTIEPELNNLEQQRVSLIKRLGTVSEGGNIQVQADKIMEFNKEFNSLLTENVSINFEPIPLSLFGNDLKLSALDLSRIDIFIKNDLEKEEEPSKVKKVTSEPISVNEVM